MCMAQHVYSHGRTTYHLTFFTFIILGLLTALGAFITTRFHLPIRFRALYWFPSCFILGFLTRIHLPVTYTAPTFLSTIWISVSVIVYCFTIFIIKLLHENRAENVSFSTFLWPNLLQMFLLFALACAEGNTNRQLHLELRMEQYASKGDYDNILEFCKKQRHISRSIQCVRAYALSQENMLGSHLFDLADKPTTQALLPLMVDSLRPANTPSLLRLHLGGFPIHDMHATNYLRYATRDSSCQESVRQYLLCSLLLERRLTEFADSLVSFYVPKDSLVAHQNKTTKKGRLGNKTTKRPSPIRLQNLPTHYAEAIILYSHQTEVPIAIYEDSELKESFLKFYQIYRHNKQANEDVIKKLQPFASTYWNYYYCKQ